MPLEMSGEKARHMLELSRALRWEFPSSQGSPIIRGQAASRDCKQANREREYFSDAERVLLEKGDEEGAIEIAANAWRLWIVARDLDGGRAFLASVLEKGEKKPSRARSLALYGDALLAFRKGRIEESRQSSQAALDEALAVDDREALTLAYLGLSRVAFEDGDYAKSASLAVKAREFARGLEPAMGQAPLFLHASATRLIGDYDQAAALFEQSLELNRKIRDQGMVAAELQNLGFVEIHRGNVDAAERYFTEGEKIAPASDPYSTAMSIINKAVIAFLRGNRDESRSLLQRAQSVFKEAGIDPGADDQFEINWLHGQLTTKKAR